MKCATCYVGCDCGGGYGDEGDCTCEYGACADCDCNEDTEREQEKIIIARGGRVAGGARGEDEFEVE